MIHSSMLFDIAENCASCHSLARKGVDPAVMAKMIDAGHPPGSTFELVQYSQGSVRHRFYPPDVTKNAEMSPAELSRDRAEAMRHLARARRVADALAAAGGDPMPSDGVASIERSYRSSIDKRLTGALARSHLAFRDILRQFDAGQVDLAHQTFQSAEPGFAAAGSPYQYWRSIYGALICATCHPPPAVGLAGK